ncbi:MAG: response regulator transcription factor [Gammaproteobacteria bacterium]|nr:response regulator transcription factor [Gammaproteobacteria bacterium]
MSSTPPERPILIVEDDEKTSSLLSIYLAREEFRTIAAYEGRQALDLARQHNPIFAILDLMIPNIDGWEVCQELRRSSDIPIMILTARGDTQDRIIGLTLGADDYVVKPFSPREVVARVKAILRRAQPDSSEAKSLLSHHGLVMDIHKRKVTLHGDIVSLTPSEFKLLQALMTAPGRIFMRDELLNRLYPTGGVVVDRVIDVHIGNLRQKIEQDPSKPRYILTARGLGYQFADRDGPEQLDIHGTLRPDNASYSERASAFAQARRRGEE